MTFVDLASEIIEGYEGLSGLKNGRYYPYHCNADKPGVMTVGRGHLLAPGQTEIKIGGYTIELSKGLTLDQVNSLFRQDLYSPRGKRPSREARVRELAGANTPVHELAALLALYYNYEKGLALGSVGANHRKGLKKETAESFLEIIYSNSKRQRGLWRRRMTEAVVYLGGPIILAKEKPLKNPFRLTPSEKRLVEELTARLGEHIVIPAFL